MVLGFMAHGYATGEFEVTIDRLGVYLPTEHIDNPKGYPDNAQTFDSRLRGPVNPRELEIDTRTGMKNYIATENGGWDTSKSLVCRVLQQCIDMGRRYNQSSRKEDHYEAYRLLGQAVRSDLSEMQAPRLTACRDSFILWRTLPRTPTSVSSRSWLWDIPTFSCMSAIVCAFRRLTGNTSHPS